MNLAETLISRVNAGFGNVGKVDLGDFVEEIRHVQGGVEYHLRKKVDSPTPIYRMRIQKVDRAGNPI